MKKNQYVKDLAHFNFLNLIKDKFDIYAISALPRAYLRKVGIKTVSTIQEGLETILMRYGKNSKISIILNSELTHTLEHNIHQ